MQAEVGRFEILLVEDNPADVRLTLEALKEGMIGGNLTVARDGVEALNILHQENRYGDILRPDLILLDLNLPKKDGREVLAEIKNDERLRKIPVVVLTTSEAEQDIQRAYELHANCYIIKPFDLDRFNAVIRLMLEYWFKVVKLPAGERNGH